MIQLHFFSVEESCWLAQYDPKLLCSETPALASQVCRAIPSNFICIFDWFLEFITSCLILQIKGLLIFIFYVSEILLTLVLESHQNLRF